MLLAGLIFVVLFNWLANIKMELYLVGIWSLFANAFIKAFFSTIHNFWLVEIDFDEHFKIVVYVITAVILAFLFVRVYSSNIFKRILIRVGKKTLGNNVFKDAIDFDKRTMMLIYLKESDYFYIGTFKFMDEHDENSYIALINYSIFNRADNSLLRNNSDNKMSIVFCLHDIEHIELLYEDNSEVWKLIGNSNKLQKTNDRQHINKNKKCLIVQKVTNRLGHVFLVLVFCIFVGVLVYLLFYQQMAEIANVIDFIVTMMSFFLLIISCVRSRMNERKQYIWVSNIYIFILSVGLIIFMILTLCIKNASNIARVVSCVCLGITIVQEIGSIIKIENKINAEKENNQEEKNKKMES